ARVHDPQQTRPQMYKRKAHEKRRGGRVLKSSLPLSHQRGGEEHPTPRAPRGADNPGPAAPCLYVAFELGMAEWKLGFTTEPGATPRVRTVPARDLARLAREIADAKKWYGLTAATPVRSCYEAGPDGFWLHRYLTSSGIENAVVDSSSIEVKRRRRRAKSDRLDAQAARDAAEVSRRRTRGVERGARADGRGGRTAAVASRTADVEE